MSSAGICRDKGWKPGTLLVGNEGYGPTVIRITAVGEEEILARTISHDGEAVTESRESMWDLQWRDWQVVA